MEDPVQPPAVQKSGLTAIDGAMALIALLLIVQLWLVTATLETYLAGHAESALPSAIISGVLFLCSLGLFLFVQRIDARVRHSKRR